MNYIGLACSWKKKSLYFRTKSNRKVR